MVQEAGFLNNSSNNWKKKKKKISHFFHFLN